MIFNHTFTGGNIGMEDWGEELLGRMRRIGARFLNSQNLLHHHLIKMPLIPHRTVCPFTFRMKMLTKLSECATNYTLAFEHVDEH